MLIVDEPDGTFREAVSKSLKSQVADFLTRGGILIILTRLPLKGYKPTRRFTLDDGELSEVKLDRAADRKVVRIQSRGNENAGMSGTVRTSTGQGWC